MRAYHLMVSLLVVMTLGSCNRNQTPATDEHVHEENLFLSSYSDEFEVFAEATPFTVGHPSDILAHFSYLESFKPLESGKVTVSLVVGTDGIRQSLENPSKPGIYPFTLTPATAGSGKLIFDVVTAKGASRIVVPNVRVYSDEHDAQHAAFEAVVPSSNGVVFTKEQSWKVDFATEPVRKEPFGQVIRTTAQILPGQGDERMITAKAGGVVVFQGDNVTEGKAVAAGQFLFSVESGDMADNNISVRYNEAVAEYNRAKAEYERKKELAKEKIVSESELLKAQSEYTNAEITYENLRKNFSAGKQVVSSPMGGFVKQVLVRNGEYVEAGQPVVVVSQNRDLLVKAELQPKYYPILGSISTANLRVSDINRTYSLEELNGKVVSYGKSTDVNNPLIPVVFQVKNSVDLLPGSFVEMYIKTQSNNQALTIPNESIVEEMGSFFVFVQLTPEFFEKRLISKGVTDGFRTEITEGISADERVVSKGAILVKLAQASGALDAHSGHVH